ncbi:MAG: hypothetical protein WBM54_05395 [Woeseia sp.]
MTTSVPIAVPRPSATVVLLRDSANGPEVLLVLRHERASFGASYVFPGGVNEDSDAAVHARCHGLTDEVASQRLGVRAGGLDFYSAAIRELFEETGILLAHRAGAGDAFLQVMDNACEAEREMLNSGELSWQDFLDEHALSPACEALHYFAFWVTPRIFKKRFSTRFFMAALPGTQLACHDGAELTDSCWMRPVDALASATADEMTLPPPTRATLKELTRFASVSDALDWARRCEQAGVECTLPAMLGPRNQQRIILPGSPDYPSDHRGALA